MINFWFPAEVIGTPRSRQDSPATGIVDTAFASFRDGVMPTCQRSATTSHSRLEYEGTSRNP
jgi:hypothetical protein